VRPAQGVGRDAVDLAAEGIGHPDIEAEAGRDLQGHDCTWQRPLAGHLSLEVDARNCADIGENDVQLTVPADCDPDGPAGDRVLGKGAVGRDPPDLARAQLGNQRAPSGPTTSRFGKAPGLSGYSVKVPSSVIRPILAALRSTNQIAPSGPSAPLWVVLFGVGTGMSVAWPVVGLSRAIAFAPCSVT
jgi:hypothetical protein